MMVIGNHGLWNWPLRERGLDTWLITYALEAGRRTVPVAGRPVHLLLCIADHFEPQLGKADMAVAMGRVNRWVEDYPRLFGAFRDSDGRPPRHTFFFPEEEYVPKHLDDLASLCRAGYGEVEVHLHHDHDTAQALRARLETFKCILAERHGLLSRSRDGGDWKYAFIHGNWALDNSRPDGRYCGVNNELDILRETGCYADFTMPSVPNPAQTRKINSIYYAVDDPNRPKSHDTGWNAGPGTPPQRSLLLIQGPLVLNWQRRKWGILPRIENGCLQGNQAPSLERLQLWLKAHVQMPSRPDWFFVKLYTHGAKEENMPVVLGEPMVRFHAALAERARENPGFHYHYVTAREMFNLVKAAEANWTGNVDDVRDLILVHNGDTRPARDSLNGRPPRSQPVEAVLPR